MSSADGVRHTATAPVASVLPARLARSVTIHLVVRPDGTLTVVVTDENDPIEEHPVPVKVPPHTG